MKWLQYLWNAAAQAKLRKIEADNKALRAEFYVFKTEVLDQLVTSNEKISKRMDTRAKRDQASKDQEDIKTDDPFDEVRKLQKDLNTGKPIGL